MSGSIRRGGRRSAEIRRIRVMFLLDTNVVSELRRPRRTNPNVAAWADAVPPSDMFLSSITILELETGALLLKRRTKGKAD
jgi:predicted nucleic acid-binding protein